MADGIPECQIRRLGDYEDCDITVIFGGYKRAFSKTLPKKEILEKHKGRRLIMVEAAFHRRGEYYAVGWGGQAGNADFNNQNVPIDRWNKIGKAKEWQPRPDGVVVVMGQLPRDVQVQDTDHIGWCKRTVTRLQAMGEQVIFRPHPMVKEDWCIKPSHTGSLKDLLRMAKCVVTWNSTSAVDAILEGVPTITMDQSSIAYSITQHRLEDIKRLEYPDRTQWLAGLGYSQWTLDEMRSGEAWRHLNG